MREYRGKPVRATAFGTDFVYGGKFEIGGKVYIVPEETGQIIEKVWDGRTIISRGRGYERATWDLLAGFVEVLPESVGQYIGLKLTGKKIYSGDILEHDEGHIGLVKYKAPSFVYEWNDGTTTTDLGRREDTYIDCKIIGNIHDNPTLLESPK